MNPAWRWRACSLLAAVAVLPVALGLGSGCTNDGNFCTSQCGVYLYVCSGGVRYPDQPVATNTVCYDPGGGRAQVRVP